jgi:lipopolysaccharide/colanic/teichoic acid biosynthesis glycosyltransferase
MRQSQRRKGLAKLFLGSEILPWVLCDILILYFLFQLFASFGRGSHLASVQYENNLAAITLSLLFSLCGIGLGFFDRENRTRRLEVVKLGLAAWLLAIALGLTVLHFALFIKIGRFSLVYGSLASILGVTFFHFLMGILLRHYPHQFVFVGPPSPTSEEILKVLRSRTDAHIEHNDTLGDVLSTQNSESAIEDLINIQGPMDIVLTTSANENKTTAQIATTALKNGLRVIDEGSFYAEIFRRYPIENLSTHWIIRAGFNIQKPITNATKRLIDATSALVLLFALIPIFLIIIIAIKITSKGNVLYIQTRQGRYSQPFRMIKFRTMTLDHNGSSATKRGDSRITSIGKLLRPLHLDELPQLINILKGEMSFVGPRPEAIEIANKTKAELPIFEIRHMVRPGLTGWAQINQGKTEDGFDEVRRKLS